MLRVRIEIYLIALPAQHLNHPKGIKMWNAPYTKPEQSGQYACRQLCTILPPEPPLY